MIQQTPVSICDYVSQKNASRVMEKVVKSKLSARAVAAVNLFLDQVLIKIIKHKNPTGKYGIDHYQTVLSTVLPDKELLKKCISDAKYRSTQLITGLSLDFVMSNQDREENSDKVDTFKDHDPTYKSRYLSHMRKFIVGCGLLSQKQYCSSFSDRPSAAYFSLPVGLFLASAIEQLARFVLNKVALSLSGQKNSSVSADRVAYIFFNDPVISQLASETAFFQSLEVKTFKAIAVDDSNLPPLVTSEPVFSDSCSIDNRSESRRTRPHNFVRASTETYSTSTSKSGEQDSHNSSQLSDHLSTNLSMSLDKSRDFEEVFHSGHTIKLSLTPSRLRTLPDPAKKESNHAPSISMMRRRSLLSQFNTLVFKES